MAEIPDEMLRQLLERAEMKGRNTAQQQTQPIYVMPPTAPVAGKRQSSFGFVVLFVLLLLGGWWLASNLSFDKVIPPPTVRAAPIATRAAIPTIPQVVPSVAPVAPAVVIVVATPTPLPAIEIEPTSAPQPTMTAVQAMTVTPSPQPPTSVPPTAVRIVPTDVVTCLNGVEYRNGVQVATPVATGSGTVSGGCW